MSILRWAVSYIHHKITGEMWPRNQCEKTKPAGRNFTCCVRFKGHPGKCCNSMGERF